MKAIASIVVATFLVVGMSSSEAKPNAERSQRLNQCVQLIQREFSANDGADDNTAVITEGCFEILCNFEVDGMLKNGKLVNRNKIGDYTEKTIQEDAWEGATPKDGKTIKELAETCFDRANVKTLKCEVADTFVKCISQGLVRPPH